MLESLISELRSFHCNSIQEVVTDVPNLNKFSSMISELKMALVMVRNGNKTTMLSDVCFEGKSPDILCEKNLTNVYVEVTKLNENPYISEKIITYLRDFLSIYSYRVDVRLKYDLSVPQALGEERRKQNALVETCIEKFDSTFKNSTFSTFPFEIDTDHMVFEIHKIDYGNGYPGIITSECIKVPERDLREYVKYRLLNKAEKRTEFTGVHRTYPYILAFDCEQEFIGADDLDRLLYGVDSSIPIISSTFPPSEKQKLEIWRDNKFKTVLDSKKQEIYWKEIDDAKKDGWNEFLLEKGIIPNNYEYRLDEGLFLSESLMKNVSGVLFKDKFGKVFFFPNPFCFSEINNPYLEKILFNENNQSN